MDITQFALQLGVLGAVIIMWYTTFQFHARHMTEMFEKYAKSQEDLAEVLQYIATSLARMEQKMEEYKLCPIPEEKK